MEKGYGFGAEGDWKTAAMVRLMKIMTQGIENAKGTSFMEDYTYNLVPGKEGILQAHMLEVCPTIVTALSALKRTHCPWVTEKIPPVLYLHQRRATASPHP